LRKAPPGGIWNPVTFDPGASSIPPDPAPSALGPGQRVGARYEVVRPLGRGGFAHTFLARDLEGGREVALKTLHGRAVADLKAYELFEREARVLLGLRHRGVPEFIEFFRADLGGTSTAVLVMEYVDGVSLAQTIADGPPLAPLKVLDLMLELLGVLDYLHTRAPPILHRDIKPANVIVRADGGPVLVDFGAVRNVLKTPGESGSTVVGTYGYMPYEQYMGQASPASDLYALGATFLHLVTGRPPSDFMAEEGHLAVPASLPVGEPMRSVIARLLEPVPARRHPSARAAREALLVSPTRPAGAGPGTAVIAAPLSTPLVLDPAPRTLTGPAAERYAALAHSTWDLMEPTELPDERWDLVDVLQVVFFSTVTAGILPLVFFGISRSRKRRLRRFFRDGIPGAAEIVDFRLEDVAFGVKFTRVRYEFQADGRTQRGSDVVLPVIADRWREGEHIEILYVAERNYDSVIISVS
jgi:serine/threonine protein kinase